jgi:predicted Zn-dependent protease with MMP-like domain
MAYRVSKSRFEELVEQAIEELPPQFAAFLEEVPIEIRDRASDVIYVFQEDVEQSSDNEKDLVRQVRITVLHEIGHHFGLSEKDLDELGYG